MSLNQKNITDLLNHLNQEQDDDDTTLLNKEDINEMLASLDEMDNVDPSTKTKSNLQDKSDSFIADLFSPKDT